MVSLKLITMTSSADTVEVLRRSGLPAFSRRMCLAGTMWSMLKPTQIPSSAGSAARAPSPEILSDPLEIFSTPHSADLPMALHLAYTAEDQWLQNKRRRRWPTHESTLPDTPF